MREATRPGTQDLVPFIYAPVQDDLKLVVANLRRLAGQSELSDGLMEQALGGSGKKVRPVVTLLAGSFRQCDRGVLVTMATAVELRFDVAHTDLAAGAAQDVHDLQPDGTAERLEHPGEAVDDLVRRQLYAVRGATSRLIGGSLRRLFYGRCRSHGGKVRIL